MNHVINIERVPEPDIRVFNVSEMVFDGIIAVIERPLKDSEDYSKLDDPAREIVFRVMNLNGIKQITINTHSFSVEKGTAFNWKNLERKIIPIIQQTLWPNKKHMVITRSAWIIDSSGRKINI